MSIATRVWRLELSLIDPEDDPEDIIYDILLDDCHDGMFNGETAVIGELSVSSSQNWEYWIQFHDFFLKQETIKLSTFTQATARINEIINPQTNKPQDPPVKSRQIKINHDLIDVLIRIIGAVEEVAEDVSISANARRNVKECISQARSQVDWARKSTEILEKEEQK